MKTPTTVGALATPAESPIHLTKMKSKRTFTPRPKKADDEESHGLGERRLASAVTEDEAHTAEIGKQHARGKTRRTRR